MRGIFLFLFISVIAVSLVLGASGNSADAGMGGTDATGQDSAQAGQETGNGNQIDTEADVQNKGDGNSLENQMQVRVQSGTYENANGEKMQIQNENGLKLKVGDSEASCSLGLEQEVDPIQNRTRLKTHLSNGANAEIKVMPNTASETAIERLQLKSCNSENNCSIELKEVGTGEKVRAAYEVKAQKDAKVLGMFKTKMNVHAQIDAETGETIQAKKTWWAFLASE